MLGNRISASDTKTLLFEGALVGLELHDDVSEVCLEDIAKMFTCILSNMLGNVSSRVVMEFRSKRKIL